MAVIINYKVIKKKCEFFVVPRNGQVLLGMPDTAALSIINVNIDSIEAAYTQKKNCNTNMSDAKKSNITEENSWGKGELYKHWIEDLKNAKNINGYGQQY